jgi:hypothetical protein
MPLSFSPIRLAAAAVLILPAAAGAQLIPALPIPATVPDPVEVVTQVTGAVPDPVGGVITESTGTVGGIVAGGSAALPGDVQQVVGQVLGGGLGQLPTGAIDQLLGPLGLPGLDGTNGVAGGTGYVVLPDGSILLDGRPPVTKVKILSKLRQVGGTGKLRLQISSDEPSVIAMGGTVRPGIRRKLATRKARSQPYSRKSIRFPAVVLAFRKAGALTVTIQFSRAAQKTLNRARDARTSVALVAVDVARNQQSRHVKGTVKR